MSLERIAALLAVTVVAACGPDPTPVASTGAEGGAVAAPAAEPAEFVLDDEEVVRRVFEAAADGDLAVLPPVLDARVSPARVGVVALHDQLLARRTPTPGLPAVLDALEALAGAEARVDAGALGPLVAAWRAWDAAQIEAETELARHVSLANAGLSLWPPGAAGLQDIADKAAGVEAPPMSGAAAGIAFVRYAALVLGEEGSATTAAQTAALDEARAAFDALGWPGGLGLMAEPIAEMMLRDDPASLRGVVLWSEADGAFRRSGDLLRSGMMHVQRARGVWRGQADVEAVRRAALLAETGRARIEESGVGGRELFEACSVHALALQAGGHHDAAVDAADAALATAAGSSLEEAEIHLRRAVSLFRLRRFDESLAGCRTGLEALGPDFEPDVDEARMLVPALEQLAAQACLELGRHDDAIGYLEAVAAFHEREAGKPWASDQKRTEALLLRARVIARTGDADTARTAVREVLQAGGQGTRQLAFAADVLLEAGFVDDADDVVTQAEQALGPARSALFGELRGRIAAARGDLDTARVAFRGAVDFVTDGDATRKSLSASRIFESWARVEENAGNRERAAELFQTAANHLVDIGVDAELQRLLGEVKRLRD